MRGTFYYWMFSGLLFGAISRKRFQENTGEVATDLAQQTVGGLIGLGQFVSKIKYPWGSSDLINSVMDDAVRIGTSKELPVKAKYIGRTLGKGLGITGYTAVERAITRESLGTKL